MAKKINPLAVNISSTKLEICSARSETPLTFAFPPTSISEMEIVNHEELKAKLQAFLSEKQVHAEPLVLVLAESMYYSKDFLTSTPPPSEDIQKYLDLVPFSSISYRVYRLPIGHRLVVINRDFYEGFKNILLSLGFSIVSVVPGFIVTGTGTSPAFSAQTCLLINRKMEMIMDNSFGGQEIAPSAAANTHKFIEGHKIIVAIGAILVILAMPVILYFYFQNQKAQAEADKKAKQKATTTQTRKPTATPTPTLSPLQLLKLEQYTLQLLNGSGTPGLAASLEAEFRKTGFTQITTGNFPSTSQTTVTYKPSISKAVRDVVAKILAPLFSKVTIKDSSQAQFDISITTGKITR